MNTLLPALIGAISGMIVASIGWFVKHTLTVKREEFARRNNTAREHLESQIKDLYGPLLGLIQHSRVVFKIAASILPASGDGQIEFSRFSERDGEVWRFFVESYFLPVNEEIRRLIRSRMYLLKDGVLPKTFEDFFVHEAQFEVLHRLWKEKAIDSSHLSGHGWPSEFELQVQTTLDHLREQHQMFLQFLGTIEENSGSAANYAPQRTAQKARRR
jgi:hypothetical protein